MTPLVVHLLTAVSQPSIRPLPTRWRAHGLPPDARLLLVMRRRGNVEKSATRKSYAKYSRHGKQPCLPHLSSGAQLSLLVYQHEQRCVRRRDMTVEVVVPIELKDFIHPVAYTERARLLCLLSSYEVDEMGNGIGLPV